MSKRHTKSINDPVHGHITLDSDTQRFIDTPQFQRLRELKQLGCTYYVFPGASHNRFEHSIGTMHLAGEMLSHIATAQPELAVTDEEIFLVKTAGLCHDLGHGPFSHVFDHQFMPTAKPGTSWHHELASTMMLDHLIDDNHIEIEPDAQRFLHQLINPTDNSHPDLNSRRFLFDIVANSRNSVDVDKFDYLQRDCLNVGMKCSYDPERLVRFSRVIDDEICFPAKEAFNLYELFHTRYSLFKQVYQHNVGKAIDFMICDALLEADPIMKISDAVFDPEEYIRLTDCVLKDIEVSRDPALSKAQAIIRRLRKRELYKLVDTILLPKQVEANMRKLTAEVLLSFAPAGCQLTVSDLIVDHMSINYALKDRNPVDNVHFFTSDHPHRKFKIPKEQVSNLIPDQFLERYIRIYLRDPEHPHKFEGAKTAVRNFLRVHTNGSLTASPYSSTARAEDGKASKAASRVYRLGRNFSGIFSQTPIGSPINETPSKRMRSGVPRSLVDQLASQPVVVEYGSSALSTIVETNTPSAIPMHATSILRASAHAAAAQSPAEVRQRLTDSVGNDDTDADDM